MTSAFDLALAAHIVGIVLWVGGLLAACSVLSGRQRESSLDVQGSFAKLARRVLKTLAHPGAAITVVAGITLLMTKPVDLQQAWLHTKLTLVVILIAVDLLLTVGVRGLLSGGASISAARLKLTRGAILLLFVTIVVLAVIKP